jgi:hypothetical protein
MSQQLPLFPLQTVLFPGAPISLHIFEERYRLMIAHCLQESSPFGVVLIRAGSEVSADDPWVRRMRESLGDEQDIDVPRETIPYAVGTTARITDSVRLEDGRFYLVANGQRRFRIQYLVQRQPYLIASVVYFDDEAIEVSGPAAVLRALYARYWTTLNTVTGHEHQPDELPSDDIALSYWMAHRLRVENSRKQRWIECDVRTRLREMAAALRAELSLLPPAGAKPDDAGHGPWSWN